MTGHSCRLYFAMLLTSLCDRTADNGKPYIMDAHIPDRTRASPDAPGSANTTLVACVSALLPFSILVLLLTRTIHIETNLDLWLTRNSHIAIRRSDNLRFAAC